MLMTKTPSLRRLSEQDLAQLYMQTEAPLRLDALLQGQAKGDAGQIAVHDSVGAQTPDLALISLSLCGLVIARDYPETLKDGMAGPIIRELIMAAEDNLVTVGRLWLDSSCYGIAPDPAVDKEIILSIPDRLRILTSIFMELRDALDDSNPTMERAIKTLYYQAESHADLADKFVAQLTKPSKRPEASAKASKGVSAKNASPKKTLPDQIPLPFDLNRPKQGADIVSFSLFRDKK